MYEQYFGLKRAPFRLAPEPDMCFSGKGYVDALACLTNAIQDYQGIIILSGFPGTGKTALMRQVAEAAIVPGTTICRINRANVTELEKTLEAELNNRWKLSAHDQATELSVEQILLASAEQDKHILIIIDDAQRLSTEDINFLVGLVSENRSVMSFFKIILVGHEKLDEFFNLDDLREQYQLTFVHCELTALERHEIKPYVMHRLEKGEWSGQPSFDDAIYAFVYQATKGIPRRVNSFFDRLLLFIYLEGKGFVDYSILKKFSEELLEEIQLEKSPDVDVYDLQQALNDNDDKPNVVHVDEEETPLDKKMVDIPVNTPPLLESAVNDIAVHDSRFAHIKKWLVVLISMILVLILVFFILSKNSYQQARLSTDSGVLLSDNVKQEIKQPTFAAKQAESVAIVEKERDGSYDTIASSELPESVSNLSESAMLGRVLPEEPAFDDDEGVESLPPVTSHAKPLDIDPLDPSRAKYFSEKTKSQKNIEQHTTKKADNAIQAEFNQQSKPTTGTQEETEKIKKSNSEPTIAVNIPHSTITPRKTNSASVSSEIELAKRSDSRVVMLKRSINRQSPARMVEPIENIPISEAGMAAAPTDEDLKELIIFLTRSYKTGEIDEFSDLFVANAVSNGSFNRKQIRDDYESLFNSTDQRQIDIKDLIWTRNGLDALGIGTFEIFISKKNGDEAEKFHGEIVIEVQKQQTKTQIKKLFYRYNVAS